MYHLTVLSHKHKNDTIKKSYYDIIRCDRSETMEQLFILATDLEQGFWDYVMNLGPKFISFFFGMVTGMVLFSAIYVFYFVRGKNIDIEAIKRPKVEVDQDYLLQKIKDKQKEFKRSMKLGNEGVAKKTFDLSYELVEEISEFFFPESKYPMLELSVNEILNLIHYITDRVDELLDRPIIKNTKNLQVIKFMQMYDKKKQVEESKVYKAAQKARIPKLMKYGGKIVGAINPVTWFRKAVINTSVNAMTRKVCIVVIGIVGEETVKVYSKALFEEATELHVVEGDVQKLLEGGDIIDEETE